MHYMEDLKDLLCAELEDYAEKGKKANKMSAGDLEAIHKLTDTVKNILALGIDTKKCRVGAEILFDQYTEEIAKEVLNAGLFAAVWDAKRRDFDEYERLISWGISEFTEDYHCSFGLNF